MKRIAVATLLAVSLASGLAAQTPRGGTTKPADRGVRVEVTVPASVKKEPITGRVYFMVARTDEREPRLQIGRTGTPFFGRDIENLAPGQAAIIDGTDLGTPVASLKDLPPGDYFVQAFVNVYSEFKRADGHTVWMHDDQWEGQHWNASPGNLYSKPQKIRIDSATEPIKLVADQVIPAIIPPADTEFVKRIKLQSTLLTKFWGRPIYLGATVMLPRDYASSTMKYPVLYRQGHFSLKSADRLPGRQRVPAGVDARRLPPHAGGVAAASGAVLRRQLRREFGQRRAVWRRDHAGVDTGR